MKYLAILLLPVIPAIFYLAFGLRNPPEVGATGGAFPYSKHGGGTVDGIPFSGVDRAVNPDYEFFYNDAADAGQYLPGECTHCHEPHASFGGSEPPPSSGGDAGPDRYLLMKEYGTSANYANLCWYCHENINYDPSYGGGTGYWKFYQGRAVYEGSSHYTSTNFYWPGTGETGGSTPKLIWPRRDRTTLPSGNKGSCLNCHTPHGIKAADAANAYDITSPDGSGGVPATMQTVASGNPSVSTDYMIPRQLISWEETLCERCHDASGPAPNIQTEINKRSPSPSSTNRSGHPVDAVTDPSDPGVYLTGKHVASEAIPVTTKHVECYDCHNPHAVKAPTGGLGDGDGGRVRGMKFIDIDGTLREPGGFRQPYVYEICLKCHGDTHNTFIPDKTATGTGAEVGGTLRTTVAQYGCTSDINPASSCTDGSNKRLEFDPNTPSFLGVSYAFFPAENLAYHPVAAPGRNTSQALCYQLQAGFPSLNCGSQAAAATSLSNLTINCTDCHNSDATAVVQGPVTESNLRTTDKTSAYGGASPVGPHGSTNVRLLRANYNTSLGTTGSAPFGGFSTGNFALCFLCHDSRLFNDGDGRVGRISDGTLVYMTNFRQSTADCTAGRSNLHAVHLANISIDTWDLITMYTACANCHYNVHSNAEATNTLYGDGDGVNLPDSPAHDPGRTRLINFSPIIQPHDYAKPRWYWNDSVNRLYCNLRCHGRSMGADALSADVTAWYCACP